MWLMMMQDGIEPLARCNEKFYLRRREALFQRFPRRRLFSRAGDVSRLFLAVLCSSILWFSCEVDAWSQKKVPAPSTWKRRDMFPVLVAALSGIPIESPSNAEVGPNDDLRARLKPASADRPQIPLPQPGTEEASLDTLEGA